MEVLFSAYIFTRRCRLLHTQSHHPNLLSSYILIFKFNSFIHVGPALFKMSKRHSVGPLEQTGQPRHPRAGFTGWVMRVWEQTPNLPPSTPMTSWLAVTWEKGRPARVVPQMPPQPQDRRRASRLAWVQLMPLQVGQSPGQERKRQHQPGTLPTNRDETPPLGGDPIPDCMAG